MALVATQHQHHDHPYITSAQSSSSASFNDFSQKLPISCDFSGGWVSHAQSTNFRKIVIVEADPDGSTFDELVKYLKKHAEAREGVREITLAGAHCAHIKLLTDVLSEILLTNFLPNLHSLTLRNVTLLHLEGNGPGISGSIRLHQLSLENIGDVTAAGILWVLGHFAQIDYLSLRDVGVVQDAITYHVNEQPSKPWHIFDVFQLSLPPSLQVVNLDVQGACNSAFYLNLMRSTPSVGSLRRLAVSCSRLDDLIALGGLLGELGDGLQSLSVGISDCFRFGANALQGTSHIYTYVWVIRIEYFTQSQDQSKAICRDLGYALHCRHLASNSICRRWIIR